MAPKKDSPLWDPYKVLDVFPDTSNFTCVGAAVTRRNTRCRWTIDRKAIQAACARMDKMALEYPLEVTEKCLNILAKHCLCTQHHQYQATDKVAEWSDRIEEFMEGHGEVIALEEEVKRLKTKLKKLKREGKGQVAVLVEEVDGLKVQLQRAEEERGVLKLQIRADAKRSGEKEAAMSKKLSQLTGRLQSNEDSMMKLKNKEIEGLEEQLRDSKARVEDAASQIDELKGQLEKSDTCRANREGETSKEIGNLKDQVKESNSRREAIGRETTKEINELKNQLKESNERLEETKCSLEGVQQSSTKEISELRLELGHCKDINAELKTAGSANKAKLERELDRRNSILEDCQIRSAGEIANLCQRLKDINDVLENLKASSSNESMQLLEELQDLKKQLFESKTRTSGLQLEVQQLKMLRHFDAYRKHIQICLKQGKAKQAETESPPLSQAVRLRERFRHTDTRLASQVGSLLSQTGRYFIAELNNQRMISTRDFRDSKRSVWAVIASQPPTFAVKKVPNFPSHDIWLVFSGTGDTSVVNVRC